MILHRKPSDKFVYDDGGKLPQESKNISNENLRTTSPGPAFFKEENTNTPRLLQQMYNSVVTYPLALGAAGLDIITNPNIDEGIAGTWSNDEGILTRTLDDLRAGNAEEPFVYPVKAITTGLPKMLFNALDNLKSHTSKPTAVPGDSDRLPSTGSILEIFSRRSGGKLSQKK
jgi:hypothetical protein